MKHLVDLARLETNNVESAVATLRMGTPPPIESLSLRQGEYTLNMNGLIQTYNRYGEHDIHDWLNVVKLEITERVHVPEPLPESLLARTLAHFPRCITVPLEGRFGLGGTIRRDGVSVRVDTSKTLLSNYLTRVLLTLKSLGTVNPVGIHASLVTELNLFLKI